MLLAFALKLVLEKEYYYNRVEGSSVTSVRV
jgi:hypothetical protein